MDNEKMNGIVVINKPNGYTSRDVINVLNKEFHTKKIGHTGTLDPIATGVLVVCIGRYTKLVDKITCYNKEYIATIKLGIKTDTLDITGNCLEQESNINVDKDVVINTLNSFLGRSIQEVPKYAAVKVKGKKLYEYARDGEEISLPKREIEIYEIELLECTNEEIKFRTVVSKGTYIRSLIRDICEKLGVIGTMSSLIRTKQGKFKIEDSFTLEEIKRKEYKLLDIQSAFSYPCYELNDDEYFKVKNGVSLQIDRNDPFLFMKYKDTVVAIYEFQKGMYKVCFMLFH